MTARGLFLMLGALGAAAAAQPTGDRAAERDLLKRLVEIPTVAGNTAEFRKATALLTGELRKAGVTDIVVKDHDGTQTLIARWHAARPSGKKPILLVAHMDVVAAKASDWKNPPFELREKDGHYLGRGTIDDKDEVAGIVLALQRLHAARFEPSRDIIVLFTGDEETLGRSAGRAANEWRSLIDAEYALNFDVGGGSVFPDGRVQGFELQLAKKTYADYKLTAANRGGHSSNPRPDNAIYALAGALKAIEAHRFAPMVNEATRGEFQFIADHDGGQYGELVKRFLADPTDRESADKLEAFYPGHTRTRCVATMLSGGHAPNALPQLAEANVNCRVFPGVKLETVRQELQQLAGPDVQVSLVPDSPTPETSPTPLRQDVLDAYKAALRTRFPDASVIPIQSAGATDGAFLRAAGMPVYGLGAGWVTVGQSYGAHGLDERIRVDAFHGQIPIIADIIRRLAG